MLMNKWLSDPNNIESVKKEYPSESYSAELNLMDKQIEITKKVTEF